MNAFMNVMHTTTCNCTACTTVPTLGIKMPYEEKVKEATKTKKGPSKLVVGENDLVTAAPKVAAMLSEKDKHFAFEVTAGSNRKLTFVCPDCNHEFKAAIFSVVRSVDKGFTGCTVCAGRKVVPGINDIASQCPKVAAMLSEKDKHLAFEVTTGSGRKLTFVCPDCGQEFEAAIYHVVNAVDNGATGCPVCAGRKVVPGINDLVSQCPKAAAMWSSKNKLSASKITAKSRKKAFFKCRNCGQEFEAIIANITKAVDNGVTGCPVCAGKKVVPGINDLVSQCPKAAAMWSSKKKLLVSEVTARSGKKAFFKCYDCGQEFEAIIANIARAIDNGTTGCPVCTGKKIVPGVNDLASQCPEAAAMWSSKNKLSASEVAVKSNKKAFFKCSNCGQEFEASIARVANAVDDGNTGCPVCVGKKIIPNVNDLASQCPEAAAMWSSKNKLSASEVAVKSNQKAFFKCRNCGQEFEAAICNITKAVDNGTTGCSVCAGFKVVPGINDLASQCPKAAVMWSSKNELSASEVTVTSSQKAIFKCRDCGREFEAIIRNVVRSVGNDFTGCYDCNMKRINAVSKPECFVTRLEMAFAGENGILNPFFDAQCILGENSRLGLDFVDNIQKFCSEYNGFAWHSDDETIARDRFKFEAAHKAGYAMIRVLEPGIEVLDPKYDIVMPEGFGHHGKYDTEIMEEVGRKVIHLLEEIYGRKASHEIWALNNFKEFEVWYDANKKELEANAKKRGPKGKTAVKIAA